MEITKLECPCPACGFYTTGEFYFGSYNICQICGWEDDHVQLANPASRGGANGYSLVEKQAEALVKVPKNVSENVGYFRDVRWRPLRPSEIEKAESDRIEKHWMHKGIDTYEQAYWTSNLIGFDIEAEICMRTTDQGGRSSPIRSGYRPQFYYDQQDWVVSIQFEQPDSIHPGDQRNVFIGFMSPNEHVDIVSVGMEFELREGERSIATGKVTRLIDIGFSASLVHA